MCERSSMEKELVFQQQESISTYASATHSMQSIPSVWSEEQKSVDMRIAKTASLQSSASSRSSARRGTWPACKNSLVTAPRLMRHLKRCKSLTAQDDLAFLLSQQASESDSHASKIVQRRDTEQKLPTKKKITSCKSCPPSSACFPGILHDLEAGVQVIAKKAGSLAKRDQAVSSRKMTQREAATTMANMFIGVGMLSLPFGFKQSGIALGLAILLFSMAVMTFTAFLIGSSMISAKERLVASGVNPTELTLGTLGHLAYGNVGRNFIIVSIVGELWFIFLTYVILQAENLQLLLGLDPVRGTLSSFLFSFICMLCPPKALSMLSSISIVAVAVAAGSLLMSGLAVAQTETPEFSSYHAYVRFGGTGTMLGLAMFSLSGHAQIGYVFTNMANPELEFKGAVKMAMGLAGMFYMCVGVLGYCFYGDYVLQTMTSNLGYDLQGRPLEGLWWLQHLTAGCFVVKLQGTTPLVLAPVLELLYKPFMTLAEIEQGKARKRRVCVVVVVALVSCVVATLLHDSVAFATALTGDVFTIPLQRLREVSHLLQDSPKTQRACSHAHKFSVQDVRPL
eukprot:TRINITY_DN24658_c0_g1_i2.p1 TRINITY_DN24658_c0_g1~~TRINITY_DN24658_c0_g1_i2.p1  ORF type:complete len:567 (-),score=87.25 TRINITY_DN24658_c0_g1_i2:217-1917(-)